MGIEEKVLKGVDVRYSIALSCFLCVSLPASLEPARPRPIVSPSPSARYLDIPTSLHILAEQPADSHLVALSQHHLHRPLGPRHPPRQAVPPVYHHRLRRIDLVYCRYVPGRRHEPGWSLRLPPLRRRR